MRKIVLIRHGESHWNKENRFTGWTDVDLTEKGREQASKAGVILRKNSFDFTVAYTSFLKRAIKSAYLVLDEMDLNWVPVNKSWRLNQKHYGMLQGLNKNETALEFGNEKVLVWKNSFDVAPLALTKNDPRSPLLDRRYKDVPAVNLPLAESLKDTIDRVLPYWSDTIFPSLMRHEHVLVVAHANSIRAIVKDIKNIPDENVASIEIPAGIPYVFEFDKNLNCTKDYLLHEEDQGK